MEINLLNEESYFAFPTEKEISAAQAACCGKCCLSCEAPAAYAWRKRDVDLSVMLEKAIKNELTDTERKVIEEYFYNSKKLITIAAERGVSLSSTRKNFERAIEKLRKALGYVVMYQHISTDESLVPLALRKAGAVLQAKKSRGASAGERLLCLRKAENLTRASVSEAAGIDAQRLGYIERGEKDIYGDELLLLSGFYGVSTDFILKGEN